jgi:hypothetical protein
MFPSSPRATTGLSLAVGLAILGWSPAADPPKLTEADVLKLVELQIEDRAIIAQIKKAKGVAFKVDDAIRIRLQIMHSATVDLYRVQFAGRERGWATAAGGVLLRMGDDPTTWSPQSTPDAVTPSCLAFDPAGKGVGLAPLWYGRVLQCSDGATWKETALDLGYSMPDAVVVDAGTAYILATDGRVGRYVGPNAKLER